MKSKIQKNLKLDVDENSKLKKLSINLGLPENKIIENLISKLYEKVEKIITCKSVNEILEEVIK